MNQGDTRTLAGRAALITGAGRRIGAAIAAKLAEHGAAVVIHYCNSRAEAEELAAGIVAGGGVAKLVQGDLADLQTASDLVGAAVHELGRPLDILVNNASIFEPGGMDSSGGNAWTRHEAINLRAPFLLARAFARQLPTTARGDILNLNDIRALRPGADYLAYTASKVGLHGLTRSLALELAPRVRVNEVALGAVLPPEKPGAEYEHVRREEILLGAFPTVDEVTGALSFFLENGAVTGQTLCIDGGQHLR